MNGVADSAPEPIENCYAANLTIQALQLGFVNTWQFRLLLVLDTLFFDRIILWAPEIIGNSHFSALFKSESSDIETFYGEVLSPILSSESCEAIADSMIEHKTIHTLHSDSDLRAHAAIIDRATRHQSKYLDESVMREQYHALLSKLSEEPEAALGLLSSADLWAFKEWLQTQDRNLIRCSALYRWAEKKIANPQALNQLKAVGEVAQQLVLCRSHSYAVFASPNGVLEEAVYQVHRELHPETWGVPVEPIVPEEEPSLGLDIATICRLPLNQLAALRMQEPFPSLRNDLAAHRSGRKPLDLKTLQGRLDEAESVICGIGGSHPLTRERLLDEGAKRARLRLLFKGGVIEKVILKLAGPLDFVAELLVSYGRNRLYPSSKTFQASTSFISGPRYAPRTGTLVDPPV